MEEAPGEPPAGAAQVPPDLPATTFTDPAPTAAPSAPPTLAPAPVSTPALISLGWRPAPGPVPHAPPTTDAAAQEDLGEETLEPAAVPVAGVQSATSGQTAAALWVALASSLVGVVLGFWVRGRRKPESQEPLLPPPGIQGILALGRRAAARGEAAEAEEWFRTAVRLRPSLVVAHLALADCLRARGRLAEAEETYRLAVELEPRDASVRLDWARLLLRMGEHQRALQVLDGVVNRWPELQPALARDPMFQELHDHPRFLALAGQL